MRPAMSGSIPPGATQSGDAGEGGTRFPVFGALAFLFLGAGGYYGYVRMTDAETAAPAGNIAASHDAPQNEEPAQGQRVQRPSTRVVHEPDSPSDQRTNVRRVQVVEAPPSPEPSSADVPASLTDAEIARHISQVEVKLYATEWCGYCRKARDFFDANGVSYREYDVEQDAAAKAKKDELSPGSGVPVVDIEGRVVSGFSPSGYARAISAAVEKASGVRIKVQLKGQ